LLTAIAWQLDVKITHHHLAQKKQHNVPGQGASQEEGLIID